MNQAMHVDPKACSTCEGRGRTRSANGPCRRCEGTGRAMVECRVCSGDWRKTASCNECRGTGVLDPIRDAKTIERQEREEIPVEDTKTETNPEETAPAALAPTEQRPRREPMPPEIAKALVLAQQVAAEVTKSSHNEGDGYDYASVETITREARAALAIAGLAAVPDGWRTIVGAHGEPRLEARWMLAHESGATWTPVPVSMPIVQERGWKADKAEAAALSYVQSQFFRQLCMIPRLPPELDVDRRVDHGDGGKKGRAARAAGAGVGADAAESPLSDAVTSMLRAIGDAKKGRDLVGIERRLETLIAAGLGEALATRVRAAVVQARARVETPPAETSS